jgi:hypothetical protein
MGRITASFAKASSAVFAGWLDRLMVSTRSTSVR